MIRERASLRSTRAAFWLPLFFVAAAAFAQPAPEAATGRTPKEAAVGSRFMAVAAHPLAADAGYEILKRGGSATDAAVAMQLVLGLVEPQSSGIGGGGFILHYSTADRRVRAYDGRETAPAAARPERFIGLYGRPLGFIEAVLSGRAVGVPGTIAVLELAHRNHGRLPWHELALPAIALAERGDSGFGYDPVFLFPAAGRTFGEMTDAEKDRHSHRANALWRLAAYLTAQPPAGVL